MEDYLTSPELAAAITVLATVIGRIWLEIQKAKREEAEKKEEAE